jgi:hypothetical protein
VRGVRNTHRSWQAPAASFFVLLALAGCGGPSADPDEVLDKAFSQSIGSAQMSMSLSVTLEGAPSVSEPLRVNLDGPYRSGSPDTLPAFDLAAGLDSGDLPAPSEALSLVSTGDNLYVEIAGQAYEIGEDVVAQELKSRADDAEGAAANPLGVDPRTWVSDPQIEGEEEVDGVKTLHLTGAVSVANMVQNLNQAAQKAAAAGDQEAPVLSEQQMSEIESVVQDPTFDLYTGADDGKIRRLSASVSFQVPESDRASLGGLTGGRVTFELTFSNVGEAVDIQAPENPAPIKDLGTQIQALTGGLGGAGLPGVGAEGQPGLDGQDGQSSGQDGADGQDGQDATGSPAPAPPQTNGDTGSFQEYSDCVAQAGQDTAKLEACTKLITG